MDYSKFDYKKACSQLSAKELEILLFKSRMEKTHGIVTTCWKKYTPTGPIYFTAFISFAAFLYVYYFIFYFFNSLIYSLNHKGCENSIARYSEIQWDPNSLVDDSEYGNGYTTINEIERNFDKIEEVKEKIRKEREQQQESSYSSNSPMPMVNKTQRTNKKIEKVKAARYLTNILRQSPILCGVVLSTKYISEDFHTTGELSKPYLTQVVSFGEDINTALKTLLQGKIKFHTKRKEKKSYVRIDNGDLQPLIRNLERELELKGIKISLVQDY